MAQTKYNIVIQWDFDNDGFDAGDNITADVIGLRASLGFADELDHVAQVGRMVLTLNNASREYSPDNTSGSHYGQQWINAPIQVVETTLLAPSSVVLWRGFVTDVQPQPGAHGGKRCIVTCEDIFGQYARSQVGAAVETNRNMSDLLNVIGSEVYKTARAAGTITFSMEGDEDDVITVGDRTYTLKAAVSTTAYEVLIGADAAETARNLAAAINDDVDAAEGVQIYGDNTFTSARVSAEDDGAGEVTVTALNRGALGNEIALSLSAPHRDATSVTVTASDGTSGTVADTHTENQTYFQVEELGGTNPAFDFYFDFVIAGTGVLLTWTGRYAGSVAHTVPIQAYDWTGATYDNLGTLPDSADDQTLQFALLSQHTDGSGNVRIRIYHNALGNANHFIRTDHIYVTADVAQTPNDITLSGSTLTGGVDGPAGLTDYETGRRSFDIAADRWSEERTNALRALQEVVESEFGYAWVARSGKITAWDKDHEFRLPAATTSVTTGDIADAFQGSLARIHNRVTVNYQPRGSLSSQVIARANNTLAIPGKTAGTRWNREVGYPNSDEAGALPGGTKLVRLPYIESETGNIVGAQDVITPRRSTDFNINDSRDLLGFDYTNDLPPWVRVSLAVTGSGVECTFSNRALDTLYVHNFQVRGTALIGYDAQQVVRENATSISTYQVRGITYNLSLYSSEDFAEQIAYYLVSRYKDPLYRVSRIVFKDARQSIGDKSEYPPQYDIGDVIELGEAETGIGHMYYIRGIQLEVSDTTRSAGPRVSVAWDLKRIDEVTYWILGDETYSVLGETTRLAL